MLSIDRQVKRLLKRDQLIRQLHFLIIALGLIIIVLCAMILFPSTAKASPGCMTHGEARAKWPKAHLYWSGPNHCWSNRRERWRRHEAPRALAQADKPKPQLLPDPVYNVLPPRRPVIVMVEEDLNECCWPPLDALLADEREITLRLLAEKMKQK